MFGTATQIITGGQVTLAASQTHFEAADAFFQSGTAIAYSVEGLLALVALVAGTVATIGKAGKEGAGTGMTHQFLVIGLAVTIFLSCGIAALITHSFESHGVRNPVSVPSPWGQ
ncbi:hypothetical protein [Mycolicibacterium sp. CBMA 226]|uniref:hypothetical protein n=1 Tax=Mycolicibacterium sp. CBMA 226 TaxID=2606611 RepID=UPI0013181B4D|nr:hypothetical protein [Mycolicibacterium sp. CBMA 226]QGW61069.1 hypothetical protein ICEMyc226_00037 [Mycolicibacterium sp.]